MVKDDVWTRLSSRQLADVLCRIEDVPTMRAFLRDVMSAGEIAEIGARLEAARMLEAGARYQDITAATRLSSRTIARISAWLHNGKGGYQVALSQLAHHAHV